MSVHGVFPALGVDLRMDPELVCLCHERGDAALGEVWCLQGEDFGLGLGLCLRLRICLNRQILYRLIIKGYALTPGTFRS